VGINDSLPEEIVRNYPNCIEAVCFVEVTLFTVDEETGKTAWEMMLEIKPLTLESMVGWCRRLMEINQVEGEEGQEQLARAIEQTSGAEFKRYVAGKLGMM
jgi:hypothetical protein